MKVIFLDIDGVMNSQVFYKERYEKQKRTLSYKWYEIKRFLGIKPKTTSLSDYKSPNSHYTFEHQFGRLKEETCAQKWEWLSEWCNENDVKICISSVWKHNFGIRVYNAEKNVEKYKSTPEKWDEALRRLGFKNDTFVGITGNRDECRGLEIKDWLDKHPEVEDYAILDDDSDMLDEQFKRFHHCDGWFGMSPNHLYRIKRQFDGISSYEKNTLTLR